jgi:drug/metabolite transporter (DMT)-like permease
MDLKAVIAGVGFALMWSSAFTSARLVVLDAPPLAALSVRFMISGLIAVLIAAALGQSARLTRAHWIAVILFGICQNALYLGLTFVALQTIEASVAVIIASLLPLVVAFASRLFFGERLSWFGFAGLVIGFAGAVMIMSGRIASGGVDMTGIALMVTALVSLTAATLLLRDALPRGDVLMIVGLQMLVGSLALLPFALALETWDVNWSWRLAAAFTYTIIVPGIAATVTWFWLVRRIGPTRAATYHFLNPFLGVAVAALVLNETVSLRDLAGVAIVAGGILAVQLSRRPKSVLPRQ